jgi:hypothetical protein|tara:strand:+ start:700 stop:834 length:135 start_codon:yes stop_codon:yes gene_type:complete
MCLKTEGLNLIGINYLEDEYERDRFRESCSWIRRKVGKGTAVLA